MVELTIAKLLTQSFTVYGLIVESIGVLMIFKWGPPQPNFEMEEYDFIVTEDSPKATGKKTIYKTMSAIALGLIFVGLVLQLYDAWK